MIRPEHLLLEEEPLSWSLAPEKLERGALVSESSLPSVVITRDVSGMDATPPSAEYIRAGLSMQEMEERLIQKTLVEVHDNRTQAAKLLGISVRTLRNKLKQYQRAAVSL